EIAIRLRQRWLRNRKRRYGFRRRRWRPGTAEQAQDECSESRSASHVYQTRDATAGFQISALRSYFHGRVSVATEHARRSCLQIAFEYSAPVSTGDADEDNVASGHCDGRNDECCARAAQGSRREDGADCEAARHE